MSNELMLLTRGDAQAAQRIFAAVAARTGLRAQPLPGQPYGDDR